MAAGVGRRFVDRVAFVGCGDGLLPPGTAVRQVLHRQKTALFLEELDHGLGDLALVEGVPASVDNLLERLGKVLLVNDLSGLERFAAWGEDGLGGWEFLQQWIAGDDPRKHVGHRKAVFRQVDGGGEQFGQLQATVFLVGGHPAVHQSRYRERHDSLLGDAVGLVPGQVGGVGGGAGGVADVHLVLGFVVNHDVAVAADARHIGLDYVQRGGGGDGGVNGISTLLQDGHASLSGQRLPRAHHPVPTHDHRAVGLKIDPVRCLHHDYLSPRKVPSPAHGRGLGDGLASLSTVLMPDVSLP